MCEKQKNKYETCSGPDECLFGLNCIKNLTDESVEQEFKCYPLFQFQFGERFDANNVKNISNEIVGVNSMCKSYTTLDEGNNIYSCQKAPRSNAKSMQDYRIDGEGLSCPVPSESIQATQKTPILRNLQEDQRNLTFIMIDLEK